MSATRRKIAKIKQGNYGVPKVFRLKDYNRSTAAGYTVTIIIWSTSRDGETKTKLVDGVACTATYDGEDTIVTYTPVSPSPFTVEEDYEAEVSFTKDGYLEDCKTFAWRVVTSP